MSNGFLRKRFAISILSLVVLTSVALAGPFTSVVVYGDSLSDDGNLFLATGQPGAPYFQGRRSDGPVAVEQLAAALGAPLEDFAWIGATTGIGNYGDGGTPTSNGAISLPGMQVQFANSQSLLGPHLAQGLFIVWGGPNDFLSPSPLDATPQEVAERAVGNLLGLVGGLRSLGAQNILVPGMPDLGLSPFFQGMGGANAAEASALTDYFNFLLLSGLPSGVHFYDTANLLRSMVANPSAYGFANTADACFNGITVCANPDEYLFWDDFHPTTATHSFIAAEFQVTVVPEPSACLLVVPGLALFAAVGQRVSQKRRSSALQPFHN